MNALIFGSAEARKILTADQEMMRRITAAPGQIKYTDERIVSIDEEIESLDQETDEIMYTLEIAELRNADSQEIEDMKAFLLDISHQKKHLTTTKANESAYRKQLEELIQTD